MTPLEITMQECLSATGLRELPQKISADCDKTWLRAICEVVKIGGRREYCLCENKSDKPSITRDFGACAAIVQVSAIFPYEYADRTIVPTFKDDNEIIHYLTKSKYDKAEIEALLKAGDREEIERRIHNVALGFQKRKIEEKKRVKEIKEYSEAVKAEKEKSRSNGRRKKKE